VQPIGLTKLNGREELMPSLVENINKRKKAGTSRSKKKSTVKPAEYKKMKKGWKK